MLLDEASEIVRQTLSKSEGVAAISQTVIRDLAQMLMDQLHKPQSLDGKFHGRIFRNRDGKEEENFVVFVPRDRFLPDLLKTYQQMCMLAGGGASEQSEAVYRLKRRVEHWQHNHKDEVKTPDAEPGECP